MILPRTISLKKNRDCFEFEFAPICFSRKSPLRENRSGEKKTDGKNPTIQYNDIIFDLYDNRVVKSNKEVPLGLVEKEIFSLLIKNANVTVNKTTFFDCMNKPSDTALRAVISKLKKLLELNISNTKGVGYKLEKL